MTPNREEFAYAVTVFWLVGREELSLSRGERNLRAGGLDLVLMARYCAPSLGGSPSLNTFTILETTSQRGIWLPPYAYFDVLCVAGILTSHKCSGWSLQVRHASSALQPFGNDYLSRVSSDRRLPDPFARMKILAHMVHFNGIMLLMYQWHQAHHLALRESSAR